MFAYLSSLPGIRAVDNPRKATTNIPIHSHQGLSGMMVKVIPAMITI